MQTYPHAPTKSCGPTSHQPPSSTVKSERENVSAWEVNNPGNEVGTIELPPLRRCGFAFEGSSTALAGELEPQPVTFYEDFRKLSEYPLLLLGLLQMRRERTNGTPRMKSRSALHAKPLPPTRSREDGPIPLPQVQRREQNYIRNDAFGIFCTK